MTKQAIYRLKYSQIRSGWKNSETIYKESIVSNIKNQECRILDIGCGHGELMADVYQNLENAYGLDPDASAIEKNHVIKNKFVGMAEKMPFESNFFDIVVCAWVLEHLSNPKEVFTEINRVLKPGGKFIFITPNIYNYNVWIIRLIPQRFHDFFTKRLYGRQENDTFKKFYLVNSEFSIDKLLFDVGFKKSKFILNGDPSYISFNNFLFWFSCKLEQVIDKYFEFSKVHIIGIYEKKLN